MQQEIQRAEIRQLEALHLAQANSREMFLDALGRHFPHQDRIIFGLARDDADVGRIAFVAGAGVRQFDQFSFGHTVTSGVTSLFGISAGQYATISSTCGRPLPSPVTTGGPFNASGAISLVKRSTAARSLRAHADAHDHFREFRLHLGRRFRRGNPVAGVRADEFGANRVEVQAPAGPAAGAESDPPRELSCKRPARRTSACRWP